MLFLSFDKNILFLYKYFHYESLLIATADILLVVVVAKVVIVKKKKIQPSELLFEYEWNESFLANKTEIKKKNLFVKA